MKQSEKGKTEARATLLEMLKPGDTVYTILRNVSRSGMSRQIGLVVPGGPYGFFHPNYAASKLLGEPLNKSGDGLRVSGCGMDMGFHVVYNLSRTLWPEGFPCIGEGCPANDHSNGDRDYTPGHKTHRDGGYALRHRWL